jgi:hypothetical protein
MATIVHDRLLPTFVEAETEAIDLHAVVQSCCHMQSGTQAQFAKPSTLTMLGF